MPPVALRVSRRGYVVTACADGEILGHDREKGSRSGETGNHVGRYR